MFDFDGANIGLVFRIGTRRCVALEKQVEGLHKASGLDLR